MQMVFSETAKHVRHSKLHSLTLVITAIPTRQEKRTRSEQGRDYVLEMLLMCLHARSEDVDKMVEWEGMSWAWQIFPNVWLAWDCVSRKQYFCCTVVINTHDTVVFFFLWEGSSLVLYLANSLKGITVAQSVASAFTARSWAQVTVCLEVRMFFLCLCGVLRFPLGSFQ